MSRLVGSARILRADNGAEVTCEELYRSSERPLVWSLDERKRLVARQVTETTPGESQETFALRLASRRQLDGPAESQYMTIVGWKSLSELAVGDRLAVPRRVPEPLEPRRMADDEVILLAHMIGDGSCIKRQPIRYASIDEENLKAVTNAAKHFGVTAKRDEYAAARVTTLRLPAPIPPDPWKAEPHRSMARRSRTVRQAKLRQVRASGGLRCAERPGRAVPTPSVVHGWMCHMGRKAATRKCLLRVDESTSDR